MLQSYKWLPAREHWSVKFVDNRLKMIGEKWSVLSTCYGTTEASTIPPFIAYLGPANFRVRAYNIFHSFSVKSWHCCAGSADCSNLQVQRGGRVSPWHQVQENFEQLNVPEFWVVHAIWVDNLG